MRKFYDPSKTYFIFLIPVAAAMMDKGEGIPAKEVNELFVGNTVFAQLSEGPTYTFIAPKGVAHGLRPEQGRITGKYSISEDGKVCVLWENSEDDIETCDKVVKQEDGKYKWGGKVFEVVAGDPKGLAE